MKSATVQKKETIGSDLKDFISETINDTAENHLEAWKERYRTYNKVSQVRPDINVKHEDGLEIEYAEETIKRELNSKEYDYFINAFHVALRKKCTQYINEV